ncbi:alpha/beta fold hydrolase [Flaviflexus huanghaiensis]|uniref:alpha/beta fold hydrolase n=1 Tax=Flaviflexus huanghaiensis TaxID=1111473 RepID=UPI0015F80BAF|nr:alpha/beta fold hydrolase [Flaviflexus huanghaiensis]
MDLTHIIAVGEPRATILILHGYAEHAGRYSSLTETFAAAGYDVFFYNQPGHGGTAGPAARVDVGQLITLHRRARAAVMQRMRTDSLILFGHSMGGIVTASSALIDPSGLAGVMLTGPAFRPYPELPSPIARAGYRLASYLPALPVATIDPQLTSRDPEAVRDYVEDPLVFHGPVSLLSGTSMAVHGRRALDNAHRWDRRVPLFIAHGEADAIANVDGSREFAAAVRLAGGVADFVPVAGGYHEIIRDPGRDLLERQMIEWLDLHIPHARASVN